MRIPWKIVAFYVGTIVAVIAIMSVVIDYGTNNLVAPDDISGQYQLTLEQGACGQAAPALLVIGQSGSYLIADLLASDAPAERRARVSRGNGTLHGQLEAGTIHLAGSGLDIGSCLNGQPLALEATIQQGQLTGHLVGASLTVAFQGQRAPAE